MAYIAKQRLCVAILASSDWTSATFPPSPKAGGKEAMVPNLTMALWLCCRPITVRGPSFCCKCFFAGTSTPALRKGGKWDPDVVSLGIELATLQGAVSPSGESVVLKSSCTLYTFPAVHRARLPWETGTAGG